MGLEMIPFFEECKLYYIPSMDNGVVIVKLKEALELIGQLKEFTDGEYSFSIRVPETISVDTVVHFFDIPRPLRQDQLGELSFTVVGPAEISYCRQNTDMPRWKRRIELSYCNLSPQEIKQFFDSMFEIENGFSKADLKDGLKTFFQKEE